MSKFKIVTIIAAAGLILSPALPFGSSHDTGAAFAKSEKSEGGGNGNGNGNGNGGSAKSTEKSNAKSTEKKSTGKTKTAEVKKKPAVVTAKKEVVAKVKVEKDPLHPSNLGKMNGALHANINAVLAHIRNGQMTNGPVALLAALAVADAQGAVAQAEADALQQLADDFDALDAAVTEQGYETVEDYLAAKAEGTATEEEMLALDPLIDAVGGVNEDGTALAETAPTQEEIDAAIAEAEETDGAVTDAEAAIEAALNKDTDMELLLAALRAKLAPYQADIEATLTEDEAPIEEEVPVVEEVVVAE